jgi:glutamate synthase (NADPH/NADH) small chain
MACAQQLARAGHDVVLFEKSDRIGGLLRYGIPDFKMEKYHIDRRVEQMRAEGVEFRAGVHVGGRGADGVSALELLGDFDAIAITAGSEHPRDLDVPGRELEGIHFAMDFLPLQNRRVAGDADVPPLTAHGKHVVVIGGGDTGSDCVGTSNRQGAASIMQFELLAQPPEHENKPLVWPYWPMKLRTSSSHEEGCQRDWAVQTKAFKGEGGKVKALSACRVDWKDGKLHDVPGSEFELKADLVLFAMGYLHPVHEGMLDELDVKYDARGNVAADTESYQTSVPKVFAAGDTRRGQSLIVWAIREGRQCARAVDEFLAGSSELPR